MTTTEVRRADRKLTRSIAAVVAAGITIAAAMGFAVGAWWQNVTTPTFVDRVLVEYPTIDAPASDIFAYGWATCAGLQDGWTLPGLATWLGGEPFDRLGQPGGDPAVFGQFAVDAAVESLCPEVRP